MATSITKKILAVLVLCLINTETFAQRFALQSFVGTNYSFFSAADGPGVKFSREKFETKFNIGLLATYQITPVMGIELGIKSTPSIVSLEYFNPKTNQVSGGEVAASKRLSLQAGMTYCVYTNQKWLRVNVLVGAEYLPNNLRGRGSDHSYNDSTVLDLRDGYSWPLRKRSVLLNVGVGANIALKQKPVGGFRLTTGIGFRDEYIVERFANIDGINQVNRYTSRASYVSFLMVVNLSTLFGGTPKQ